MTLTSSPDITNHSHYHAKYVGAKIQVGLKFMSPLKLHIDSFLQWLSLPPDISNWNILYFKAITLIKSPVKLQAGNNAWRIIVRSEDKSHGSLKENSTDNYTYGSSNCTCGVTSQRWCFETHALSRILCRGTSGIEVATFLTVTLLFCCLQEPRCPY